MQFFFDCVLLDTIKKVYFVPFNSTPGNQAGIVFFLSNDPLQDSINYLSHKLIFLFLSLCSTLDSHFGTKPPCRWVLIPHFN